MAVVFKSGDMRHKVDIQVPVVTTGEIGGEVKTWQTVAADVFAQITPTSGAERMAAAAIQSSVSHTIMIRWRPVLSDPKVVATMRIVYGTRIFNIHDSENMEERNRIIVLSASEGMNDG